MDPIKDDDEYRKQIRSHFMDNITKGKFQQIPSQQHYPPENTFQSNKMPDFELYKQQYKRANRSSGGDADRMLYDPHFAGHGSQAESYRGSCYNENVNFNRHYPTKPKPPLAIPLSSHTNQHKYHPNDANAYLYETDSNIGGVGPGSEESNKSQKSSKTVVSKKSSQDLRKMVKSQCKLHEVIDETLKQMCSTEPDPLSEGDSRVKEQTGQMGLQKTPGSCKRCTDKVFARSSQKDVMTEISKGDFLECRSGDTLTISVDDVVNSKVINPMIRKLQRMYLNNLREEMSLMEDLERLPHKVNEVYKATIFKQKE
ncbi:uncharacterized protein LOC101458376 [Ceratitis capitata]|uniref:Uncharacterized protein n=1 Tax=Ceratitis capitata TaxID=7213 RepID=W8BYV6_CERCA|nr:uncharacterized protein LOC101458376 [Ceratitis capitata]